jgi:hydroxyacylglutathione hydrolase
MTDLLEDEFGDILGKGRFGLGLSVADIARLTEVPEAHIEKLEAYQRQPSKAECDHIAKALRLHPESLWAIATSTWAPAPVELDQTGTRIKQVFHPPMRLTQYIVGDHDTGQAIVIDPGAEPEQLLAVISDSQWTAVGILITHADSDHVDALDQLNRALDVPIFVHPIEKMRLSSPSSSGLKTFSYGDRFTIGPFEIEARGTPGHSPGHASLVIRDFVMAGDAIFAGSLGRTSMGSAHYANHLATVETQLLSLPGSTRLFPGHGPPTTVAEEHAHNPFFASRIA